MSFVVEIASVPDRDGLVAEIWYGDDMVAEIQRDPKGGFTLEIYPSESSTHWLFDLQAWIAALELAQRRLV